MLFIYLHMDGEQGRFKFSTTAIIQGRARASSTRMAGTYNDITVLLFFIYDGDAGVEPIGLSHKRLSVRYFFPFFAVRYIELKHVVLIGVRTCSGPHLSLCDPEIQLTNLSFLSRPLRWDQMRNSSFGSKEKSGWNIGGETTAARAGQETDPLLQRGSTTASSTNHQSSSRRSSGIPDNSNLRERRSSRSSSPIAVSLFNQRFGGPSGEKTNQSPTMNEINANDNSNNQPTTSYTQIQDEGSRSGNMSLEANSVGSYQNSSGGGSRSLHSLRRSHQLSGREGIGGSAREGSENSSPLLEIPEEIYRVRRAALQVLKPLTRTWVSITLKRKSFSWHPKIHSQWSD